MNDTHQRHNRNAFLTEISRYAVIIESALLIIMVREIFHIMNHDYIVGVEMQI